MKTVLNHHAPTEALIDHFAKIQMESGLTFWTD